MLPLVIGSSTHYFLYKILFYPVRELTCTYWLYLYINENLWNMQYYMLCIVRKNYNIHNKAYPLAWNTMFSWYTHIEKHVIYTVCRNILGISADSGPEKPENPNFENETRQTRTRNLLKYANPIKPEPEL